MKERDSKRKTYLSIYGTLAVVLVFVAAVLFSFQERVKKREADMQKETMQELANQGSIIVETKLEGYVDALKSLAEFLPDEKLHSRENLHHLQHALENLDFQRLGIADLAGDAVITDGSKINIKDRLYFQKACENQCVITGQEQSRLLEKRVFFVAVPVLDQEREVSGVLYGVVEVDKFQLYEDTSLESASQYIQIIDREGNYIVKEYKKNLWENESAFDIIREQKSPLEAERIISKIKNGERLLMEMTYQDREYLIYYSPLKMNDWYIMTLMDKSEFLSYEKQLWGEDLFWMMFSIIGAVALLAGVIIFWFRHGQKEALRMYREQKLNEEILRQALLNSDTILLIYDFKKDTLRFISRDNLSLILPTMIEHARKNLAGYFPQDPRTEKEIKAIFQKLDTMDKGEDFVLSLELREEVRRYRLRVCRVADENNQTLQFVGALDDITAEERLENEVRLREQLLSGVVCFLTVDLEENRILEASRRLAGEMDKKVSFTRFARKQIQDKIVKTYQEELQEAISLENWKEEYQNGQYHHLREYVYLRQGRPVWLECDRRLEKDEETGHIIAYVLIRDIDKRKKQELLLQQAAGRDYLTGLYNRRSGTEKINQLLEKDPQGVHAFVIFDLDNFKSLNDELGHQMGDRALKDVGEILTHHFREYDVICRLAGDEFVVFLLNIPMDTIKRNLESLLKKLCLTYEGQGKHVEISASAGVAISPMCGKEFNELYKRADQAMYKAKRRGKKTYEIYRNE